MLMLPPSVVAREPARPDSLERDLTVGLKQRDLFEPARTEVRLIVEGVAIGTVVIPDEHPDPARMVEQELAVALPKYRRAQTRERRLLGGA